MANTCPSSWNTHLDSNIFSLIHSQYTEQLCNSIILLQQTQPLKMLSDSGLAFVGNEYI